MSFCNKADKEWQTNWPAAKEEKWDKDGRKLFKTIEKVVGYGIKRSADDGFIIATAAFIGVLNICKLKYTYEIWSKLVLTYQNSLCWGGWYQNNLMLFL